MNWNCNWHRCWQANLQCGWSDEQLVEGHDESVAGVRCFTPCVCVCVCVCVYVCMCVCVKKKNIVHCSEKININFLIEYTVVLIFYLFKKKHAEYRTVKAKVDGTFPNFEKSETRMIFSIYTMEETRKAKLQIWWSQNEGKERCMLNVYTNVTCEPWLMLLICWSAKTLYRRLD